MSYAVQVMQVGFIFIFIYLFEKFSPQAAISY